ncbi:MAG: hypothetical protein ABF868_04795 [Sporolactobacillus sp.]
MKEFFYQLAAHSEWIDKIKNGTFAFPANLSFQQRRAVIAGVSEAGNMSLVEVAPDGDWIV